jgi:hypothetical protein
MYCRKEKKGGLNLLQAKPIKNACTGCDQNTKILPNGQVKCAKARQPVDPFPFMRGRKYTDCLHQQPEGFDGKAISLLKLAQIARGLNTSDVFQLRPYEKQLGLKP